MHSDIAKHLNFFRTEVKNLYSEIKAWVSETNLRCEESTITINEKNSGEYQINRLTLLTKEESTKIAEIEPIGAWVIGANGRIDIKGIHDRIIIVHLNEGEPSINSTIIHAISHSETHKRPFFKGIDEDGWYWIEHKLSSKGHKLTAELFFDILSDISDYECQ